VIFGAAEMNQQIAIITLGVADLSRSRRFYGTGFGWVPFANDPATAMYRMNGFVLSTWLKAELAEDMRVPVPESGAPTMTLAHAVRSAREVETLMQRLIEAGGKVLRSPGAPAHGGLRGYVADPDGHPWEVLWNPAWAFGPDGFILPAAD
jgi:predicted lactoylglutathione lyase